jgi:hypothetical protein
MVEHGGKGMGACQKYAEAARWAFIQSVARPQMPRNLAHLRTSRPESGARRDVIG